MKQDTVSATFSDCKECPAGFICPNIGIYNYTEFPCQKGYICEAGKSGYTPSMLCPKSKFCLVGEKSFNNTYDCPSGRYCGIGTGAEKIQKSICEKIQKSDFDLKKFRDSLDDSEKDYIKNDLNYPNFDTEILLNQQEINKYCVIGNICPKNYYCPRGTSSLDPNDPQRPKACPAGTNSKELSYNIQQCIMKFTTRYIDFKDSKRVLQIQTQTDYLTLKPMMIYKFEFNKALLEITQYYNFTLGKDYDVVFEFSLVLSESRNILIANEAEKKSINHMNVTQIYMLENISKPPLYPKDYFPYMKIPLSLDGFGDIHYDKLQVKFFLYNYSQTRFGFNFLKLKSLLIKKLVRDHS